MIRGNPIVHGRGNNLESLSTERRGGEEKFSEVILKQGFTGNRA